MRPIRHPQALFAAAAAAAAVFMAPTAPPVSAEDATSSGSAVPLPDDDPFYDVPAGVGTLANGEVIRSRRITAYSLVLPLPADAWQVLYKTLDNHDRPTATTTTVLVPRADWSGPGPRPLLSYQTAEDGISTKCAPSYALHAGLAAGDTNSNLETSIIKLALMRGWALSVPDYEGPRSLFLAAKMEAHGVLDGIRAARRFGPAGIDRAAPIGLMGYSGGAYASGVAAQLQPTYAPGLEVDGVALGGFVASIRATIDAFNGSPLGGAIMMGIAGVDRAWPEARIRDLITAEGEKKMDASQDDCINDAVRRHGPFFRYEPYAEVPDALDVPRIDRLLKRNSPSHLGGVPDAPVFHYHTLLDEYAPLAPARRLTRAWCAAGVRVKRDIDPLGEHATGVSTWVLPAFSYLGKRFAGKPAPSSC